MEILAPAGSMDALRAAVYAGADAVYFGGEGFNARAFARGVENLAEATDFAHLYGADAHFTLNTAVLDREMDAFLEQARLAAEAGVDAFIVADLGAFRALKSCFPDIPLHASTQLSIRNVRSAVAYAELGFSRLVLARELSAEEVAEICGEVPCEIEVFAHGALCVCASGQCLMSSLLGGRSANRGACAQPCRQEYTLAGHNGYFLNTRDLCLADQIKTLEQCGVTSIKIEGRMKNELYVAAAVRAYKEALEAGRISDETRETLLATFSRGGFTTGRFGGGPSFFPAFPGHTGIRLGPVISVSGGSVRLRSRESLAAGDAVSAAGADARPHTAVSARRIDPELVEARFSGPESFKPGDMLYKKSDKQVMRRLRASLESPPAVRLSAEFTAEAEQPCILAVQLPNGIRLQETGPVPEAARTVALSPESVRAQLSKTGGTPFVMADICVQLSAGLSLPVSALNRMRRSILDAARQALSRRYGERFTGSFPALPPSARRRVPRKLAARVRTPEQAAACSPYADILYIPWHMDAQSFGECEVRPCVPALASDKELQSRFRDVPCLTGCLLPDMKGMAADASFNVCNSFALEQLAELGARRATLSQELNAAQMRDLAAPACLETEAVVYGYQTLMVTEHCPVPCDGKTCRVKEENLRLQDATGRSFRLVRESPDVCRVKLLNSFPLYAADILNEVCADILRLEFTTETPAECAKIARSYRDAMNGERPGKYGKDFTRGHLRRGIQ